MMSYRPYGSSISGADLDLEPGALRADAFRDALKVRTSGPREFGVQRLAVADLLERVPVAGTEIARDRQEVVDVVQGRIDGGPELARDAGRAQEAHRLRAVLGDGRLGASGDVRIPFPDVLHVHGDVVDEAFLQDAFDHPRMHAVRVELRLEADGLDRRQE